MHSKRLCCLERLTSTHTRISSYECIAIINEGSVNFTTLNLSETLAKLRPIGLDAMDGAELMNRLDQKFLIQEDWIPTLLLDCQDEYQILEVEGERVTAYENQFVETPALDSFENHVRGRKNRFKARIRKYGSNGIGSHADASPTSHYLFATTLYRRHRPWPFPPEASAFQVPLPPCQQTLHNGAAARLLMLCRSRSARYCLD